MPSVWTNPNERVTGTKITDQIYNQELIDNLQYIKPWIDLIPMVAVFEDQKAAGTNGGTFTSGAWRTRDLNTEVSDAKNIVTLAGNQFTPVAGTYLIIAAAPASQVDLHQARLRNVTAGSTILVGSNARAGAAIASLSRSYVVGVFAANGVDAYEIQHQCQTTFANGFGLQINTVFTVDHETYTQVMLIRIT